MNQELTCPSCGAPTSPESRLCDYCRSPVATVRCASCYHMNVPVAGYCSGCGRQLGLEPIPEDAPLCCPTCGVALHAFAGGPGRLHDCARCGGQFIEHALLRDLLERREIVGAMVPRRELDRSAEVSRVQYMPCPACTALMNRQNFGGSSGVIVDHCARHGVWFDAGELPRVLAFVEGGGLAKARRRQLEELARAQRDARVAAILVERTEAMRGDGRGAREATSLTMTLPGGDSGSLTYSSPPAWSSGVLDDAREGVVTVLKQLGELLNRPR